MPATPMKIVKVLQGSRIHPNGLARDWGLRDNGELYYRLRNPISGTIYPNWWLYSSSEVSIPLSEMVKIANAFGHLMVLIDGETK